MTTQTTPSASSFASTLSPLPTLAPPAMQDLQQLYAAFSGKLFQGARMDSLQGLNSKAGA